jgi:1-deoxy-D-xylulose-5-phosphate synthase
MAVRYARGSGLGVPLDSDFHAIPIGNGEILREGSDVALVAIGISVPVALSAAKILASKGIEASVVNARFVSPLDNTFITKVAKTTGRLVTIEENVVRGGFGSAVLTMLEQSSLNNIKTHCIGIPDEFVEHGTQPILRAKYGLDGEGVARQVQTLFPELGLPS